MNCFFCKKSLTSEPYDCELNMLAESDISISYICDAHPVKVGHRNHFISKFDVVYFSHDYNDYTYSLYFYLNKSFEVVAFPIGKDSFDSVIKLDFHPDITPENVAEKLPIYILFS